MIQMNLTDIYRTFHPNIKEYTFFSAPQESVSETDHILGNKAELNRYKRIVISPYILSDYHGSKLDFNNNTNCRKLINS